MLDEGYLFCNDVFISRQFIIKTYLLSFGRSYLIVLMVFRNFDQLEIRLLLFVLQLLLRHWVSFKVYVLYLLFSGETIDVFDLIVG